MAGHLAREKNRAHVDRNQRLDSLIFKDEGPGTDFNIIYNAAIANMSHGEAISLITTEVNEAMRFLVQPKYWNEILFPLAQRLFAEKELTGAEIEAFFDEKGLQPLT